MFKLTLSCHPEQLETLEFATREEVCAFIRSRFEIDDSLTESEAMADLQLDSRFSTFPFRLFEKGDKADDSLDSWLWDDNDSYGWFHAIITQE
jgi:hypothetical protein